MFDLLLVLVRNPGRTLEKDVLLQSVWPDSFVEEGNISFNIRQLRKALGDDAQTPLYIETIPRQGYRFIAKVDEFVTEDQAVEPALPTETKIRRPSFRRPVFAAVSGALLLIAALFALAWFLSSRSVKAAPILSVPFALEKLSTDGQVHLATISRDGKTIVYSRRSAGKQSLWVMQLGTGENSELVPLSDFVYYGVVISPDGKIIYYSRSERTSERQPDIYRKSILGGVPQRIISEAQGWISLSPDGSQISFVRCPYTEEEFCSLWVGDSQDGANERKLISRPQPIRIADNQFSPNGKTIAFSEGQSRTYSNDFGLAEVNTEGTQVRDITSEKFFNISHLAWLPNGELLLTARREPDKNFRIWQVSSSGAASPLTDDSQSYSTLAMNDDGNLLITSQVTPSFHLKVYSLSDPDAEPRPLANAQAINFASNDEIIFSSARTGNQEIWSINSDGSNERQLTNNPSDDVTPIASADNTVIFFASNRTGKIQVWKMNRDGSNQTQVTFIDGGNPVSISSDGQWLIYKSALEKSLKRVLVEGGREESIFDRMSRDSAISPTGDRIALTERTNKENILNVIALSDQTVIKSFTYPQAKTLPIWLGWSHDEKYLAYVLTDDSGAEETLWFQPMDGAEPRKVVAFSDEIFEFSGFAISPDGKTFAAAEGSWNHDLILIKGLR